MRGLAWGVYNGRVQRGVGERDMVAGTFVHAHTSLSSSLAHPEFNGVLREEAMGSAAHEKS